MSPWVPDEIGEFIEPYIDLVNSIRLRFKFLFHIYHGTVVFTFLRIYKYNAIKIPSKITCPAMELDLSKAKEHIRNKEAIIAVEMIMLWMSHGKPPSIHIKDSKNNVQMQVVARIDHFCLMFL